MLGCTDMFANRKSETSEEGCKGVKFHYRSATEGKSNPLRLNTHKRTTFLVCYSLMLCLIFMIISLRMKIIIIVNE